MSDAFKDFVNANLGIRKVLVSDFGPPIGQGKSDTASGPIGSQYIDLNTGPNYILYEKTGPNNDTDWVEIRKIGEAGAKPHEPNYSVQFASGDKLGGSSNLTYNYDTNLLKGVSGEFDTFKVLGDLHVLGTSYVHEVKDTTIEGTISGYTGKFTDLFIDEENVLNKINAVDQKVDIVSGDLIHLRDDSIASFSQQALDLAVTGEHLHEHIDTVSGNLAVTGEHLHEHIDTVSGNLTVTGEHLHEHIDTVSGNLAVTGEHLHEHIDTVSGNLAVTGEHLHEHIDTISGDLIDLRDDSIASFTQQALDLIATGEHLHEHIDTISGDLIATGEHLHEHIDTISGYLIATGEHLHEHIDTISGDLIATGEHLHEHIDTVSGDLIDLRDDSIASFAQQASDLTATGEHLHEHIDTVSGDLIDLRDDSIASFAQQSLDLSNSGQTLLNDITFVSGESIANFLALSDDTHILEDRLEFVSGESLANIISVSDDIVLLKDDTDREFIIHSGQNLADHILLSMDIFNVSTKLPNLSSLPIPPNTNFMAIEYSDVSNISKYQFIPQVSTSVRIDFDGNNQVYASSVYNVSDTGFYVKFNPQVIESDNFLDITVSNKA